MMFFGSKQPDETWLELTFRTQIEKSAQYKLQLELYKVFTIYANPMKKFSYKMLYDKVRRYIDQKEINKLHRPIDLTKGPQARSSTQAVMNSDDLIVARNHCKYQAMWGKCTKGRHCPHEHVNYPRVRAAHKSNRRPLPGQGPRPNNERFRPNKIRGWNVRRDSPRSRSTGGEFVPLKGLQRGIGEQPRIPHRQRTTKRPFIRKTIRPRAPQIL